MPQPTTSTSTVYTANPEHARYLDAGGSVHDVWDNPTPLRVTEYLVHGTPHGGGLCTPRDHWGHTVGAPDSQIVAEWRTHVQDSLPPIDYTRHLALQGTAGNPARNNEFFSCGLDERTVAPPPHCPCRACTYQAVRLARGWGIVSLSSVPPTPCPCDTCMLTRGLRATDHQAPDGDRLYLDARGGWDTTQLVGQRVAPTSLYEFVLDQPHQRPDMEYPCQAYGDDRRGANNNGQCGCRDCQGERLGWVPVHPGRRPGWVHEYRYAEGSAGCYRCGDTDTPLIDIHTDRSQTAAYGVDAGCIVRGGFLRCSLCDLWYRGSSFEAPHNGEYGRQCEGCWRDTAQTCGAECGEYLGDTAHGEEPYTCPSYEDGEPYHSQDCHDDHCDEDECVEGAPTPRSVSDQRALIHPYGYTPLRWVKRGTGPLYYGVELEIDHGTQDRYDTAAAMLEHSDSESLYYITQDGSLDNGFEITTHPMSIDAILNDVPWDTIARIAVDAGYKSHDAGTCGLHVHFSKAGLGSGHDEIETTISNLIVFSWRHWHRLVRLARRDSTWASPNIDQGEDGAYGDCPRSEVQDKIDKGKIKGQDHGSALNLSNTHTVEFRMPRGTLRVATIRATIQLVDAMVRFAKATPYASMLDATWQDFEAYVAELGHPELVEYLSARMSDYRGGA